MTALLIELKKLLLPFMALVVLIGLTPILIAASLYELYMLIAPKPIGDKPLLKRSTELWTLV